MEVIAPNASPNQAQYEQKSNLFRAIFFTLLLISIYRFGIQIPIPFLNEDAFKKFFGIYGFFDTNAADKFSIFSLGIIPYVSAYLLVEILSLFIPPLKRLRKGDFKGRRKLKQIALTLTLFLGILHSIVIIKALKGMQLSNGIRVLDVGYGYEFFLLITILTMGVFFLIVICELITKFGIGQGVSLLLFSGICLQIYNHLNQNLARSRVLGFDAYFPFLCGFLFLIFLTVLLLKAKSLVEVSHKLKDKPYHLFQFNFCPSSSVVLGYASSIVMLPATVNHFFSTKRDFADWFLPGTFFYEFTLAVLIFLLSYIFAWLFLHPTRRLAKMQKRGWQFHFKNQSANNYLLRSMLIYNLPWTGYLCLLGIVPRMLITCCDVPFYVVGASVPLIVAIGLDIYERLKFSMAKNENTIKIAEFHDIYDAAMIKNHLNAEGILCHLQGYYHRHVLYFFGPYIEMNLLVPYSNQNHARDLIKKFHGGLGLLQKL